MASAAAALLDELMGRNRNTDPNSDAAILKWDHQQVCKHFLCGYCPNELFTNTKADLGPCNLIHDDPLKKEYKESDKHEKMGYEERWIASLEDVIGDVDKKIKRGHQRLAMTQESEPSPQGSGPRQDQIKQLSSKIDDLVYKAEILGSEGKVEEAQGVMKLCDQLKKERYHLENLDSTKQDQITAQAKQMEVCPVCGAFLIVGDAESRQREHLLGKQHMGYAQMRATVDEFHEKRKAKRDAERAEQDKKREDERKKREEREKARRRSRSPDRRDRGRDRGDRDRGRSDRDRGRSDRDRTDRGRADRDRGDRDRRDRDRGGRRGSSRDRRRSRSRERRRSRSRDRGTRRRRSRSRDMVDKDSRRSRDRRSRDKDGDRRRSSDRNGDSKRSSRAGSREKDRDGSNRSKDRDSKREDSKDREDEGDNNKDSEINAIATAESMDTTTNGDITTNNGDVTTQNGDGQTDEHASSTDQTAEETTEPQTEPQTEPETADV